MPERQLRQRIRAALQRSFPGSLVLGWAGNFWSGAGWPDLLFIDWPLLLGLEVKQGRQSKPTPVQGARHSLLREHHVPVYVVHTPVEAVQSIRTLKEKLPMAFDPALLAELDAALSDAPSQNAPEPVPDPEPTPFDDVQTQATADQNAFDLSNGTAVFEVEVETLDPDKPAPDIEDMTAATLANEKIESIEAEDVFAWGSLQASVDALTAAIRDLLREMQAGTDDDVPQTVEAPAPRSRRTRRS